MDAQADARWQDRDFHFIWRRHGSEYEWAKAAMADYTGGVMDTSTKYSVARMYASRRPQEWERRMMDDGWLTDYKAWLNLRNDDLFMHCFPSVDASLLFEGWETISEVVPQLNRSVWAATDGDFAPEMSQGDAFLSMDNYYFDRTPQKLRKNPPEGEQPCISVEDWAKKTLAGENANPANKLTPLEVADKLDAFAQRALDALPTLESQIAGNAELKDLLLDIRSMSYLGQYYADKQRCAAHLMLFRLGGRSNLEVHSKALSSTEKSRDHWKQYADVLESHYKTSLHSKTGWFKWYDTLASVEAEVLAVKGEGALPVIEFLGLSDGDALEEGYPLEVKVNVSASGGAKWCSFLTPCWWTRARDVTLTFGMPLRMSC